MSQLEYSILKQLLKEQERTNELLEMQISLLTDKQKKVLVNMKKEGKT